MTYENLLPHACGDFQYVLREDGTAEIISYDGASGTLTIPPRLNGVPVTALGEGAFYDCDQLRRVVLPSGIERIGRQCFHFCTELTQIILPERVTEIDDEAFAFCDSLQSVAMPEHVRIVGNPFAPCVSLARVLLIPGREQRLINLDGVLYDRLDGRLICALSEGARGIHRIPKGTRRIEPAAFYACKMLTDIHLPDGVAHIGLEAFSDCPAAVHTVAGSQSEALYQAYLSL